MRNIRYLISFLALLIFFVTPSLALADCVESSPDYCSSYTTPLRTCSINATTNCTYDFVQCNTTTHCKERGTETSCPFMQQSGLDCRATVGAPQTITNPSLQSIFGVVNAPSQLSALFGGGTPEESITNVLSKVVELLYIVAAVIFVFYLLYSGLQFIYSEGNKETVAEARGRITWAIVGIIFMALVFVLLKLLSIITGFQFFQ